MKLKFWKKKRANLIKNPKKIHLFKETRQKEQLEEIEELEKLEENNLGNQR